MDKRTTTLQNLPEMANGEIPSPLKLNRSFLVIQESLNKIENTLSDVHDDSAVNAALSSLPLHNASMGRFIGPTEAFQSYVPFKENFTFGYYLDTGRNVWHMPIWALATSGTHTLTIDSTAYDYEGNSLFASQKHSTAELSAIGDWKYDTSNNTIISFGPFSSGTAWVSGTSHLEADRGHGMGNHWFIGNENLNVMPPSHLSATSLVVETSTSTNYSYIVKMGLHSPAERGPIYSTSLSMMTLGNMEVDGAWEQSFMGINPITNVTSEVQLKLPASLLSYLPGDEIPKPHLYLITSTSAFLDARYYYRDATSFYVSQASLSTGAPAYRVVTSGGADIASHIKGLQHTMRYHRHNGPQAISHYDLANQGYNANPVPPSFAATPSNGWNRPTIPSILEGNHHPQYISRFGWTPGDDLPNLCGMITGDLVFAINSTNARENTYANAYDTSIRYVTTPGVRFGGQGKIQLEYSTLYMQAYGKNSIFIEAGRDNYNNQGTHRSLGVICGTSNRIGWGATVESVESFIFGKASTSTMGVSSYGVSHHIYGDNSYFRADQGSNVSWLQLGNNQVGVCETSQGINFISMGTSTNNNNISSSTNANVLSINPQGNVTLVSLKDVDYLLVGASSFTSTSLPSYMQSSAIYRKAEYIMCDAARQATRAITPTKMRLADAVTGYEIFSLNTQGIMEPLVTGGMSDRVIGNFGYRAGIKSLGTEVAVIAYLDLQDDCHMRSITLSLDPSDGMLAQLCYYDSTGYLAVATSTSITGSPSSFTWTFGTGIGTYGDRFPNLTGSAVDMMFRLQNTSASDPTMTIYAGTYTYDIMRF